MYIKGKLFLLELTVEKLIHYRCCMIDIETALFSQEGRRDVLRQLSEKIESAKSDTKARSVCKKLAEDGFIEFKKRFLNMLL